MNFYFLGLPVEVQNQLRENQNLQNYRQGQEQQQLNQLKHKYVQQEHDINPLYVRQKMYNEQQNQKITKLQNEKQFHQLKLQQQQTKLRQQQQQIRQLQKQLQNIQTQLKLHQQ